MQKEQHKWLPRLGRVDQPPLAEGPCASGGFPSRGVLDILPRSVLQSKKTSSEPSSLEILVSSSSCSSSVDDGESLSEPLLRMRCSTTKSVSSCRLAFCKHVTTPDEFSNEVWQKRDGQKSSFMSWDTCRRTGTLLCPLQQPRNDDNILVTACQTGGGEIHCAKEHCTCRLSLSLSVLVLINSTSILVSPSAFSFQLGSLWHDSLFVPHMVHFAAWMLLLQQPVSQEMKRACSL